MKNASGKISNEIAYSNVVNNEEVNYFFYTLQFKIRKKGSEANDY